MVIQIMYPGNESTGGDSNGVKCELPEWETGEGALGNPGYSFYNRRFHDLTKNREPDGKPDKICGRVDSIREGRGRQGLGEK